MSGQIRSFKLFIILFLLASSISVTQAQERFWVNGSGSWDDRSHWAETSGGPGGAKVPTKYDDVIIDQNSFSQTSQYIRIDDGATCKNLIWKANSQKPVLTSRSFVFNRWTNTKLSVYGSIQLPANSTSDYYGDIILKSGHGNHTINIQSTLNADLIIDAQGASYLLKDNLNTSGNIRMKQGHLNTNGKDVSCNAFIGSGVQPRSIDLTSSTFRVEEWNFKNTKNLDYNEGTSIIQVPDLSDKRLQTSHLSFKASGPSTNDAKAFSVAASVDSVDCYGSATGSITLTVTDGSSPYTYTLDTLNDGIAEPFREQTGVASDSYTFDNLYAGTYKWIVEDASFNSMGSADTVYAPPELSIDTIKCIKALSCSDSRDAWMEAVVSGGTPPYTFTWELDEDLVPPLYETTLGSDSSVVTTMAQGSFRLTVEDNNGCQQKVENVPFLSYTGPYQDSIPDSISIDNVDYNDACEDANNGSISISASGGTGTINYYVIETTAQDTFYSASGDFNNLAAGDYETWAYDDNWCTKRGSDVTIAEIPKPNAFSGNDTSICADVNYTTSPLASASDYSSIEWTTTGNGSFSDPDSINTTYNHASSDIGSTITISLTAYGNGSCADSTHSFDLTINALPIINATSNSPICEGNDILLDENGGEATSWSWENPDGTVFSTAQSPTINNATPTDAGWYKVTIQGPSGCQNVDSVDVTVNPSPSINATSNSPVCEGNDIQLDETGGDASSWSWEDPSGTVFSNAQAPTITNATPADAGWYKVTIQDANGCQNIDSVNVTVDAEPTVNATSNSPVCEGNDIQLDETGGEATSWSWEHPDGTVFSSAQSPAVSNAAPSDAGWYKVTVQGPNGCQNIDSVNVTVNPTPAVNATSNTPVCEGNDIQLDETGGDATSWNWEDPSGAVFSNAQSPTISNATPADAGWYTVTIQDANGCQNVDSVNVTVNATPSVNATSNSPVCEGNDIQLDETGGDATSWSWEDPSGSVFSSAQAPTISNATPADAGWYKVTIQDANGCQNIDSVNVTVNAKPAVNATSNSPICEGEDIQLDETGGDATSWSWEDPSGTVFSSAQSPTISNATPSDAGWYKVTVQGVNGCENVDSVNVTVNPTPAVNATSNSPVCEGNDIQLDETGGDATSWSWEDPSGAVFSNAQSPTISNAAPADAGWYTVTIQDANGCQNVDSVNVTVNATPSVNATSNSPVCEGNDIQLDETGGDATSWSWEDPSGTVFSSAQSPTVSNATPADAGWYKVTITDGNGCENIDSVDVTVHAKPAVNATSNSPICEGEDIQLDETGGEATSWSWEDPSGTVFSSAQSPTISNATPSDAGWYKVTVQGVNGCENVDSVNVTVNPTPAVNATSNSPVCEGNDIQLDETGGDATSWSWEDPSGAVFSNAQSPTLSNATPADAGWYTVTIQGPNGCQNVDSVNVTVNATPAVNATSNSPVCEGNDILLDETGGEATSWSWEDPSGAEFSTAQSPTISDADPADSGWYVVTIQGPSGCQNVDSVDVTVTPAPTVDAGPDSVAICYDAASHILANSSASDYNSLQWTTSGDGTFDDDTILHPEYTPGVNDKDSGSVWLYLTAVGNGPCNDAVDSIKLNIPPELNVSIGSPRPFLIDTASTEISVSVEVESHTYVNDLSYYLVSPTGKKLRLASSENCFLFSENTDLTFNLQAADTFRVCNDPLTGTYKIPGDLSKVHGSDPANGAWKIRVEDDRKSTFNLYEGVIKSAEIRFTDDHFVTGESVDVVYEESNINEPILEYSGSGDPAATVYTLPYGLETTCYGSCDATAVLFITGGSEPFDIEWSNTADFSNIISSDDTTDLCAGTYYVRVTDTLNCQDIDSVTVTQPPEIVIDSLEVISIGDNNGCYGDSIGEVHVDAQGGTGSLEYMLYDTTQTPNDTLATNATGDFTGLPAGEYVLEIFDDRGCNNLSVINITQPDSIEIVYENYTSLTLPDAEDGTIDIYATGGTSPLTYILYDTIANPDTIVTTLTPVDTAHFTGLAESDYYVKVTDSNGCDSVQSSIFHIAPMELIYSIDSVICPGDSTGQIAVEVIGGISPFTYQWTTLPSNDTLRVLEDTTLTRDTLSNLWAGEYVLNVIDDNGFNIRDTLEVGEPNEMILDLMPDSAVQCYNSVDSFWLDITHGDAPYQISWYDTTGNLVSSEDTVMLSAGQYFIQVADSNGCSVYDSVTITQPDEIRIDSISPVYPEPYGLKVTASGGNDSLYVSLYKQVTDTILYPDSAAYNELNGSTFARFDSIDGGTYKVIATDSLCRADTLTITIPISVELSVLDSITCNGLSDGSLVAEITGGNENKPFTYNWSDGTTNVSDNRRDTLTGLNAGSYSITIIDKYGMSASDNINMVDPPAFIINASVDSAYCKTGQFVYGNDKGGIHLDVEGGRPFTGTDYKYQYQWGNTSNPVPGLDSLVEVGSGSYSVAVYDRYGCKDSTVIDVPLGTEYELDAMARILLAEGVIPDKVVMTCPSDSLELETIAVTNADSAYWQTIQDDFMSIDEFEDTLKVKARENFVYYLVTRNEKCKDVIRTGITYFYDSPELNFTRFNGRDVSAQDSAAVLEKNERVDVSAYAIDSIATSYSWEPADYFSSIDQLSAVLNIEAVQESGQNETTISIETVTKDTSDVTGLACRFSDYLDVSIIPNVQPVDAFSPNGDGINDNWLLKYGSDYEKLEVMVFNRWGVQVYRQKGNFDVSDNYGQYIKAWDGKTSGGRPLPTGTYYYIIDPHVTGVKILRGTVTIIR